MRPFYRVGQFLKAFRRPDAAALRAVAAEHLSAKQLALFDALSPYDQQHAVEVLERLRQEGGMEADLAQAALLHDAGKAFARTRLWHRVAHVLAPERDSRLLRAYARHAEIGAELAEQAGTSPVAVALIREHHRKVRGAPRTPFEAMLAALQKADEVA